VSPSVSLLLLLFVSHPPSPLRTQRRVTTSYHGKLCAFVSREGKWLPSTYVALTSCAVPSLEFIGILDGVRLCVVPEIDVQRREQELKHLLLSKYGDARSKSNAIPQARKPSSTYVVTRPATAFATPLRLNHNADHLAATRSIALPERTQQHDHHQQHAFGNSSSLMSMTPTSTCTNRVVPSTCPRLTTNCTTADTSTPLRSAANANATATADTRLHTPSTIRQRLEAMATAQHEIATPSTLPLSQVAASPAPSPASAAFSKRLDFDNAVSAYTAFARYASSSHSRATTTSYASIAHNGPVAKAFESNDDAAASTDASMQTSRLMPIARPNSPPQAGPYYRSSKPPKSIVDSLPEQARKLLDAACVALDVCVGIALSRCSTQRPNSVQQPRCRSHHAGFERGYCGREVAVCR
jgi:hypothetical protein